MFLCRLTFWSTFGSILGSILEPFGEARAPLDSSWGLWAWILTLFCCTFFSDYFLMDFGVHLGGGGVHATTGKWVTGHVSSNMLP